MSLRWLLALLYRYFAVVPMPPRFTVFFTGSPSLMQLHIQPAAAPSHVTVQTAILTLNGTAQSPVSIPIGAADFVLGPVSETDSGSVSLVYANALGVVGPAESLDFSVANMLPVPQPAAFTLKVTADPAPMVPTPAPLSPLA